MQEEMSKNESDIRLENSKFRNPKEKEKKKM